MARAAALPALYALPALLVTGAAVVVAVAPEAQAAGPGDAARGDAARGRVLFQRFECNRCHDGTDVAPAPREKHCVHCHQSIRGGEFEAPAESLARWQKDIVHLLDVPTLDGMRGRIRPSWVRAFLLEPRDLRPQLGETMPRFALSGDEAADLAAYLAGDAPPASTTAPAPRGASPELLERGRRLAEEKGCGLCHRMTGAVLPARRPPVELSPAQLRLGLKLAPDLAEARHRLYPATLTAWLRDPAALKPGTPMPRIPLTDEEAEAIATFLLSAPLSAPVPKTVPVRLPVLERPVRFDEVNAKVFRKTCWHCHAEPAFAFGDGGAGNTGGFGFAPRRLDLSSYPAMLSGSVDDAGKRRSIFKALPEDGTLVGGAPRVVAHLLARQAEEVGQPVSGVRGMPLGLPALSPEEVQLVETWIAQGRRR